MTTLHEAAQAVLDRWNSPKWEWAKQGPTAELMQKLKEALDRQATEWIGLTDSEVRQLAGSQPSMKEAVRDTEDLLRKKNAGRQQQCCTADRTDFERRCLAQFQARRAAGTLIDDNGAPATAESLFWKEAEGQYGVRAFNIAWKAYQWGVEAAGQTTPEGGSI